MDPFFIKKILIFNFYFLGLPMIVSCWNKTDRIYTSIVYGAIAFNIFGIVRDSLNGASKTLFTGVPDPSGLLTLLSRVIQMFMIGIRFYPVLVAYRSNIFIINFTSAIYMWLVFVLGIAQYGKCESISTEVDDRDREDLYARLPYFLTYKVLSSIPLSIFSSMLVVNLTYRSFVDLFRFILEMSDAPTKALIATKNADNAFCAWCNCSDDNELIYCQHDLNYVYDLLKETHKSDDPKDDEPDLNTTVDLDTQPGE